MNQTLAKILRRIVSMEMVVALVSLWLAVQVAGIFYGYYLALSITSHGFGFGEFSGQENKGILILDYRYGDNKNIPSRPADWQLKEGKVPQFNSINTSDPPADTLYVKWRVLATGKEYEDTVDLKSRLPEDMDRKIIHFMIDGEQLKVYVIDHKRGHPIDKPRCPARIYFDNRCDRIYPDHWKNY